MTKASKTPQKERKLGASILLIIACSAALSALFLSLKFTQVMSEQRETFESTVAMLTQQQSSTEARVQAHQAVALRHFDEIKQTRMQEDEKIQRALQSCQHVSDDWRIYKARHLLELAQLNANFSYDNGQTLAMLQAADNVLAPLHNPQLLEVRQKLADEVHALKTAETVDITKLFTQLNTAEKETWTLPITPAPKAAIPEEQSVPKNQDTLQNMKTRILKGLNHVVTIRYHEDASPTPTLAYEAMLRATVRMNLEEAKWAVLERNEAVYRLAIGQAIHYLEQTFASNNTRTQALITLLDSLQKTKLNTTPVVPTEALTELNKVLQKSDFTSKGDNA